LFIKILLSGVNAYPKGKTNTPTEFALYLHSRNLLLADSPNEGRYLSVCIDHPWRPFDSLKNPGGRRDTVLVRLEPKVVLPSNYRKTITSSYKAVISVGGDPQLSINPIPWPQVWPNKPYWRIPSDSRKPRVITVSSNKFSFVRTQLYSLRRESIAKLPMVDIAGRDWEESLLKTIVRAARQLLYCAANLEPIELWGMSKLVINPKNFIGALDEKAPTMSSYQYALVIENDQSYMSEKLFDALFAGCVPIYVGPDVSKFDIPKDLVIQAEPNIASIRLAVQKAELVNQDQWRQSLDYFLSSESTKNRWSEENVYEALLKLIQHLCEKDTQSHKKIKHAKSTKHKRIASKNQNPRK